MLFSVCVRESGKCKILLSRQVDRFKDIYILYAGTTGIEYYSMSVSGTPEVTHSRGRLRGWRGTFCRKFRVMGRETSDGTRQTSATCATQQDLLKKRIITGFPITMDLDILHCCTNVLEVLKTSSKIRSQLTFRRQETDSSTLSVTHGQQIYKQTQKVLTSHRFIPVCNKPHAE